MPRPPSRQRSPYGEHLYTLRCRAGITQQALAAALGVNQSVISFFEYSAKRPRGELVPQMARLLGVTADELLNPPRRPRRRPRR